MTDYSTAPGILLQAAAQPDFYLGKPRSLRLPDKQQYASDPLAALRTLAGPGWTAAIATLWAQRGGGQLRHTELPDTLIHVPNHCTLPQRKQASTGRMLYCCPAGHCMLA